nr:hypothetical protein [Dechloromonas sp.]
MQQRLIQRRWINRLGDEVIHARRQTALEILGKGISGHCQNRQGRLARQLADTPRGFQAVNHQHLYVHQDQVKTRPQRLVQCVGKVLSNRHLLTCNVSVECRPRQKIQQLGKQCLAGIHDHALQKNPKGHFSPISNRHHALSL